MLFFRNIALLALLFILLSGGYLFFYNRHINRELRGGSGVRFPAPGRIAVHLLVVCAVIAIVLACLIGASEPVRTQGERSWLRVFSAEELSDSWAGIYSQEANPGYTRREEQDGQFSFIIFESETPHDGLHPDFLIFFRHTGNPDAEAISWYGNFDFIASEQSAGLGAGGSASEYFLAVGAAEADALFTLAADAYSDADEAKALAEFAGENGSLSGASSVTIRLRSGISP